MGSLQRVEREIKERTGSSEAVVAQYDSVVVRNQGGLGCLCTDFQSSQGRRGHHQHHPSHYLAAVWPLLLPPHGNVPTLSFLQSAVLSAVSSLFSATFVSLPQRLTSAE